MSRLFRTIVLCLVFTLLAGCDAPTAQLPEHPSTRESVLERFRVSRDGFFLLLPVEIQGRKYPFALDTGTTVTVYDTSLRSFLGQHVKSATGHTPDGEILVTFYSSPSAKLGHINLPTMSPVLCLDLRKIRETCGEEVYGLLGMDFLGGRVFRIDFDRGEVTFLRSIFSDLGVRIPITFHNGVPQVQVTIPGLPEQEFFQVDTGSAGRRDGNLRAEVFDALEELSILKLGDLVRSATASGSGIRRVGRVAEISLGPFHHKNLLFSRSSKLSTLGVNHWSRYVVTFDFLNGALYLKKGRQFERTDE